MLPKGGPSPKREDLLVIGKLYPRQINKKGLIEMTPYDYSGGMYLVIPRHSL